MPKSKHRKARFAQKPRATAPAARGGASATAAPAGTATLVAGPPAKAPRPATPSRTMPVMGKGAVPPVPPYVGTELKVIGILTVAIFGIITALYFILH